MIESSNQERSSLIHLGAKPACLKWLIGMSPNEAEGEGAPPLKAGPLPETGGGQREGLLSQAWSVEALPAGAAVLSEIHGGEAPKRAGRGDEGGGAPPSKGQGWGAEAAGGGGLSFASCSLGWPQHGMRSWHLKTPPHYSNPQRATLSSPPGLISAAANPPGGAGGFSESELSSRLH